MDRRSFLGSAAALGLAAFVRGGEANARRADIGRLIGQLGSPRFREREAATKALEKVGAAALPALRKAAATDPDPEIRRRAAAVLETLALAPVRPVGSFRGHTGCIQAITVLPDGRQVISGGADKTLQIWDIGSGRELWRFGDPGVDVSSIALVPDTRQVLVSGYKTRTPRLFDLVSGRVVTELRGHREGVACAAVSPDGRRALTGSYDKTVRLWRLPSGKPEATFVGRSYVLSVAFVPKTHLLVSAGPRDTAVRLWDTQTRRAAGEIAADGVNRVAVTPDGRVLAAGVGRDIVRLSDSRTGKELRRLEGHDTPRAILTLAFSADGTMLASGSSDETLRLWDVATGAALRLFRGHTSSVYAAAFTPDGRRLISGSYDHTALVWRTGVGE